ncbi:MAG: DeoR/GlpR family DNA-binding transcription regulator [Clostridiaceae bacterium]
MFCVERQQKIQELLKQKNSVQVSELASEFIVSETTIRRDLQEMEAMGILTRIHGGAMNISKTNYEMSFKEKEIENIADKKKIAEFAANMIKDRDTIMLDSGTTTLEIAKRITAKNITVITNSIDIAIEISNKENIELIVAGGNLRYTTRAMVGNIAQNVLGSFRVDKTFVGTNAISVKEGLSTPNYLEAQIKKVMLQASSEKIIVADSSKFNKVCFSIICGVKEISSIITDKNIEKDILSQFRETNIPMILC